MRFEHSGSTAVLCFVFSLLSCVQPHLTHFTMPLFFLIRFFVRFLTPLLPHSCSLPVPISPPLNSYWYFHYDLVLFCCSCKALFSLPCQLPSFSPFQIMRKLFFLPPKAVLFLLHKLLSSSYPLLSAPLVAHVLLADFCYSRHLEMLRDHSPVHVLNAGVSYWPSDFLYFKTFVREHCYVSRGPCPLSCC